MSQAIHCVHCVRWEASPSPKGAPQPHFAAHVYCNERAGWVDQDTTWYVNRPRPRRHCVRWGPSSFTKSGTATPTLWHALLARSPISAAAEHVLLFCTNCLNPCRLSDRPKSKVNLDFVKRLCNTVFRGNN